MAPKMKIAFLSNWNGALLVLMGIGWSRSKTHFRRKNFIKNESRGQIYLVFMSQTARKTKKGWKIEARAAKCMRDDTYE